MVGQLDLDHVTAVTGLTLTRCALQDGVTCVDAYLREVDLSGSHLSSLNAESLRTDGNVSLEHATVTMANQGNAVRLMGADIGRYLDLDHARIINETGPALRADGLRVGGGMFLRNVTLRGAGEDSAVRLLGAHIGGDLSAIHAEITNDTGPTLSADGLRVGGTMFLRGATVTGTSELWPAVGLIGAHIGRYLDLDHVRITNKTGPALGAEELRVDNSIFLRSTTVTGGGNSGAVVLSGARIGGQLDFVGARVCNESGPLVVLIATHVTGVLSLPASVVCPDARTDISTSRCPGSDRRISVRGLAFSMLTLVSWRQWLHLLMHHTAGYVPQPYQQLAAVERAAGHDYNARQVLIAQQEDLRRRLPAALGGQLALARHWLWGSLGRYGYRAHRLVIALAILLTLAGGLGYAAGQVPTRPDHHAAERVQPPTAVPEIPGTPCSTAELIGLGIDRGLPLGATGLRARCDLDTSTQWGQAFTYMIWALQALVWALATLAIAAYTGLVRKPG